MERTRAREIGMAGIYYVPPLMPYPLIELGGHGPLALLLPANGFPPDSYHAVVEPLLNDFRVASLPPRALWEDAGPAPTAPGTWVSLADDVLEGMRRHELPPAVAIGHSFGAVIALLAALRERGRFRALALLDPTILPPAVMTELEAQRQRGETSSRGLVKGALTRRNRFDSTAEAFAYWRQRPLFADWSDAGLWSYTRAMLRPADGGGFRLSWPPGWEAHYYESIHTETWSALERLDPGLPILVVAGERSDTFLPEAASLFAARVPWAEQRTIAGHGHLFPFSAPEATGRILQEWLTRR